MEFFNYLQSFSNVTNDLIILGDFNFSDISWDSLCGLFPTSAKFCDIISFIFNLNFSQLICEPTHIAGNTLDLILTNIPDCIFNVNIHSEPPLSIPSDHYIATFDVQTLNHDVQHNRATTLFDFANLIKDEIKQFILSTRSKHHNQPKWFDSSIRHNISCV